MQVPLENSFFNISEPRVHTSTYTKLALIFSSEMKSIAQQVKNLLFELQTFQYQHFHWQIQWFLQKAGMTRRYLQLP